MYLEIKNVAGASESNIAMLRQAFDFVCKKLEIEGETLTVRLMVLSERTLQGVFYLIQGSSGGTEPWFKNGAVRMFIVDARGEDDPIKIFLHEMTHVADMLKGRLSFDRSDGSDIWDGQKYPSGSLPHDERPWEKHAIEMAASLFKEFLNEQHDRAA